MPGTSAYVLWIVRGGYDLAMVSFDARALLSIDLFVRGGYVRLQDLGLECISVRYLR
jgi:hypothetical protein